MVRMRCELAIFVLLRLYSSSCHSRERGAFGLPLGLCLGVLTGRIIARSPRIDYTYNQYSI